MLGGVPLTGCHSHEEKPASSPLNPAPPDASANAPGAPPDADVSLRTNVSPAHPTVPDTRPVIVAFGDSLTAGYGTNQGESYPDFLQRNLDASGYRYNVVNEGVSGNTTKDGVERLSEVVALHALVVIVAFGGNDGLRGLPIS